MPKTRLGMNLKRLREKKGFTQNQLAKKAGMARVSEARIEAGIRKDPPVSVCKRLAKALGVPITELID